VNLERIRGLELQESGDYEVVLTTQARPRLSRRFKKELQNRLSAPAGIKRSE
jgi:DNA-binding LytR/AlgR family response regulator